MLQRWLPHRSASGGSRRPLTCCSRCSARIRTLPVGKVSTETATFRSRPRSDPVARRITSAPLRRPVSSCLQMRGQQPARLCRRHQRLWAKAGPGNRRRICRDQRVGALNGCVLRRRGPRSWPARRLPRLVRLTNGVGTPVLAQIVGSAVAEPALIVLELPVRSGAFTFISCWRPSPSLSLPRRRAGAAALSRLRLAGSRSPQSAIACHRSVHRRSGLGSDLLGLRPGRWACRSAGLTATSRGQFRPGGGALQPRLRDHPPELCAKLRRHTSLAPSGPAT